MFGEREGNLHHNAFTCKACFLGNSDFKNVLEIAWFATKNDKKCFYWIWVYMVKSSNLDCEFSINNPPTSFLYTSIFHHPTSIFFHPSSIFHLQLFFLNLWSKCKIFDLKYSENSRIFHKKFTSAACTAYNFFQVWWGVINTFFRQHAASIYGFVRYVSFVCL